MVYINISLVLVFLFFLGRYLFSIFKEGFYRPEEWAFQVKEKKVSAELYKEFRQYKDKIRFFSWWLQINRLRRLQIPGAFAELGVYKGESARILHLMDPSRTFHLFDTFRGFEKEDLEKETGIASTYSEDNFADTSIEAVKKKLGKSDKFIFHPGYFPQSAMGLEHEKFAFVNIDADLYNPIKSGLEYFYPRLVSGGIIFIHDYNYKWVGCRKAVDEFTRTIPEKLFMFPDQDGTVAIIKS
ncbi:MAG: TylF/MycF/NovP-related O-methyltransferase [Bacteroidales bacterium]